MVAACDAVWQDLPRAEPHLQPLSSGRPTAGRPTSARRPRHAPRDQFLHLRLGGRLRHPQAGTCHDRHRPHRPGKAVAASACCRSATTCPRTTYTPASVAAIAEHARRQSIAIELGTRGCRPDHLRRFIALPQRFGSPILRVVTDKASDEPSIERGRRAVLVVAEECLRAGVVIAIENHDRLKSQQLAAIAAALPATVGICLDTVNSLAALEGPEVVVETLGPYVVNLHLKDFAVVRRGDPDGVPHRRPAGRTGDAGACPGCWRNCSRSARTATPSWNCGRRAKPRKPRRSARRPNGRKSASQALRRWIAD